MKGVRLVLSRVLLAVMIVVQVFGTTNISKVQAATSKNLESVIVSGGTFNTGIKINQNYSAELTFSLSTLNQYKNLYVAAGSKYNVYRMRYEANSGLFAAHGWYNQKVYVPTVNEEITIANKKNVIYVNGSKVLTETYQSMSAVSSLKFGDFVGSIKSFRVWNESSTLIASYIPVLDENGKACMYDTVNKKYVYYTGTCKPGKVIAEENPAMPDDSNQTDTEKTESTETTETSGTDEDNNISNEVSVRYADVLELKGGNFNTGLLINQDYSIEMTFSLADTTQYKDLYSAANASYNVYRLRSEASNGLYATHGWYNQKIYTPKANEEIKISQKKNVTYINDKQVLKMTYQQLQATNTLKFGNFKGTIKSFKVWNASGKLVGAYLPAVDESGKACMYDTANKKYIYYSGTCQAVVTEEEEEEDIILDNGADNDNVSDETEATPKTFRDELKKMILSGDMTTHNISKYGMTYRQVDDTWNDLKNNECYIALNTYGFAFLSTTKNSAGIVQTIYIYNSDADFVNRYQRTCAAVDNFLAGVDSKMTDLDKILYAHEYIVKNTTYRNSNNIDGSAGGVLGDKRGRCQGYAYAMILLLHEMGINSYYITSSAMNHGWLMVELNGQYYHIDPTWDNTQPGTDNMYYHRFLMRTDEEFLAIKAERAHYSWYCSAKTGITSTSTSFSNWFVHDVAGCMYYYNGLWYYQDIANNSIVCSDVNGNHKSIIIDGSKMTNKVRLSGITSGVLKYTVNGSSATKNL